MGKCRTDILHQVRPKCRGCSRQATNWSILSDIDGGSMYEFGFGCLSVRANVRCLAERPRYVSAGHLSIGTPDLPALASFPT